MDDLGLYGKECLYIGDNPKKDFYGARKLGWKTVHVKRTGGVYTDEAAAGAEWEADFEIKDLGELIVDI